MALHCNCISVVRPRDVPLTVSHILGRPVPAKVYEDSLMGKNHYVMTVCATSPCNYNVARWAQLALWFSKLKNRLWKWSSKWNVHVLLSLDSFKLKVIFPVVITAVIEIGVEDVLRNEFTITLLHFIIAVRCVSLTAFICSSLTSFIFAVSHGFIGLRVPCFWKIL